MDNRKHKRYHLRSGSQVCYQGKQHCMCIALFCSYPVSIQKFILAFLSVSIVSGAPSCAIYKIEMGLSLHIQLKILLVLMWMQVTYINIIF